MTLYTIPANPGYYGATMTGKSTTDFVPVIGWHIGEIPSNGPKTITILGVLNRSTQIILTPNKEYVTRDGVFSTLGDALSTFARGAALR